MSEHHDSVRSYRPGDWFGIVGERALVILPPSEKSRVASLWELIDDGAGFDVTLDALISGGLRDLASFVLVSTAEGETKVVLRGPARAVFSVDGEDVELEGSSATTWVERSMHGVQRMSISVDGEGDPASSYAVDGGLFRISAFEEGPVREAMPEEYDVGPGLGAHAPAGDADDDDGELETDELELAHTEAGLEGAHHQAEPEAPQVVWVDPEPSEGTDVEPLEVPLEGADVEAEAEAQEEPQPDPAAQDPVGLDALFGAHEQPANEPEPSEPQPSEPQSSEPDPSAWGPPWTPKPPSWTPAGGVAEPPLPPTPSAWGTPDNLPETEAMPVPTDVDHDGLTRTGSWQPEPPPPPGIPGQPPAPDVTRPVARLVISNGESIEVDRRIVIGRAPEARRFSETEQPRLVTVPSPHLEISSTHIEVRPGSGADHGSAVVTDLGSTNGTVLVQPGLGPEDLEPGVAVQLIPGAVIDLGDGVTIQVLQR